MTEDPDSADPIEDDSPEQTEDTGVEESAEDADVDFESSFERLEEIVTRLDESDDLTLDESLDLYEEGVELVERCRGRLEDAEDRLDMEILD